MPSATAPAPISVQEQRNSIVSSGLMADPLNPPKGVDPKHVDYLAKLIASQQRAQQVGLQPVTIVNLNPYRLVVCNPLWDGLEVEANKPNEAYSALVITNIKYTVNTGVDKNYSPEEFWPIQLAEEYINQYRDKGGVFIIRGDLQKNPEIAYTQEFKDKLATAKEELYRFAFKMKTAGDAEWNRPNRSGRSNIHAQHRLMAQILLDAKRLAKAPEWMDSLIAVEDVLPTCSVCQADLKKGTLMCPTCFYVVDPAGAFKAGAIQEENLAFERLTRAEVVALGISAYVAETSDEVQARRAAGDPKPLSLFERKQMAARAGEVEEEAKPAGKKAKE